jgi:hypothetical protein
LLLSFVTESSKICHLREFQAFGKKLFGVADAEVHRMPLLAVELFEQIALRAEAGTGSILLRHWPALD